MAEHSSESESIRIAHLTMLQGVISRMAPNSFTLKALSATFGSAAVAVIAATEQPSPTYAIAAVVPMVIFCIMDAQYLRLERAYRTLYDEVRIGKEVEAYSLNAEGFLKKNSSTLRLALIWSVCWFYITILLSLGTVALVIGVRPSGWTVRRLFLTGARRSFLRTGWGSGSRARNAARWRCRLCR